MEELTFLRVSAISPETPKSASFASPRPVMRMLSGLISRWIFLSACKYSRPPSTQTTTHATWVKSARVWAQTEATCVAQCRLCFFTHLCFGGPMGNNGEQIRERTKLAIFHNNLLKRDSSDRYDVSTWQPVCVCGVVLSSCVYPELFVVEMFAIKLDNVWTIALFHHLDLNVIECERVSRPFSCVMHRTSLMISLKSSPTGITLIANSRPLGPCNARQITPDELHAKSFFFFFEVKPSTTTLLFFFFSHGVAALFTHPLPIRSCNVKSFDRIVSNRKLSRSAAAWLISAHANTVIEGQSTLKSTSLIDICHVAIASIASATDRLTQTCLQHLGPRGSVRVFQAPEVAVNWFIKFQKSTIKHNHHQQRQQQIKIKCICMFAFQSTKSHHTAHPNTHTHTHTCTRFFASAAGNVFEHK